MDEFDYEEDDSWMLDGAQQDLNIRISDETLCQLDLTFNSSGGHTDLNNAHFVSNKTLEEFDVEMSQSEIEPNERLNKDEKSSDKIWSDEQEQNLNMLIDELDNNEPVLQTAAKTAAENDSLPDTEVEQFPELELCCSEATRKLAPHLDRSEKCKVKLAKRLGLSPDSPTVTVIEKRKKVVRYANDCKNRKNRRVINKSSAVKLLEAKKKIGLAQKPYTCYRCNFVSNKKEGFVESTPNQMLAKSYETDSATFVCVGCETGSRSIEFLTDLTTSNFLKHSSIDRRSVLVPDEHLTQSCHLSYPPTLFLPNAIPTKKWWNCKDFPKQRPDLLRLSTVNTALVATAISVSAYADALYEHRLSQIQYCINAKNFMFKGKVVNSENRTIQISPINSNLSNIKGTTDYYEKLFRESQVAFQYFGQTALSVQIELKKNPLEIWKQYLIEENVVAVIQKELNGKCSYEVHKNHRTFEACTDNCEIVPLQSYLTERNLSNFNLEEPKFLRVVTEHYRRLFQNYTTYICNLDEIRAEHYISTIHFPQNSEPVCKIILWPEFLCNFNTKLVTDESVTLDDVRVLESKFDSILTTVIDHTDIGSQSAEIRKVNELVCNLYDSSMGSMPSNYNLIKQPVIPRSDNWGLSEVCNTLESLFLLKTYFIEIFNNIPKESFSIESKQTLNDILDCISRFEGFKCEMTEDQFCIKFPEKPMIKCSIDEVLYKYITDDKQSAIEAIYHRALSITREQGDYTLIVKRPNLSSAYISAYNPNILLLSESKCYISFIAKNVNTACSDLAFPCRPTYPSQPQYLVDHEEVSLIKGFYLSGGTKFKLVHRSNGPIFFDPSLKKLKTYKKVSNHDPIKHYQDLNSGQWMERLNDMYDHYLDRIGNENLTFMQFCMHFHQNANEDTEDTGIEPESLMSDVSIKLISFDSQSDFEMLPQIIETRSGKKMMLQKNPKLFYYPNVDIGSDEFKEISVLYYYPHNDTSTVKLFIDEIFAAKSDRFAGKSKLEVTRMHLHPLFSLELYNSV